MCINFTRCTTHLPRHAFYMYRRIFHQPFLLPLSTCNNSMAEDATANWQLATGYGESDAACLVIRRHLIFNRCIRLTIAGDKVDGSRCGNVVTLTGAGGVWRHVVGHELRHVDNTRSTLQMFNKERSTHELPPPDSAQPPFTLATRPV